MGRKLMIATVALIIGMASLNESKGQSYNTGIGLRLGVSNGFTVKHFIRDDAALEGILHSRWRGFIITGLYEVHKNIQEVRGLSWFYGGGAHIGNWNSGSYKPRWADDNFRGTTVLGIDGIIGLDYVFDGAPINLSLDYKPAFNLTNYPGFWGDEVALSIRFIF